MKDCPNSHQGEFGPKIILLARLLSSSKKRAINLLSKVGEDHAASGTRTSSRAIQFLPLAYRIANLARNPTRRFAGRAAVLNSKSFPSRSSNFSSHSPLALIQPSPQGRVQNSNSKLVVGLRDNTYPKSVKLHLNGRPYRQNVC
jgi:hypothetical protein